MALSLRTNLNVNSGSNDKIVIKRTNIGTANYCNKKVLSTFCKPQDDKNRKDMSSEVDCNKRVQDYPEIPEGIRNIDETDEKYRNPALCAEYTPFLYSYLRQMEQKLAIRKDFMQGMHINGRIRSVLIDWLIDVHNQFKLLQETLYLAIFLLDRFMQLDGVHIKRSRYQLVGVTALFTASKIEEMYPPEIRDFVYITDNSFTLADIKQMEMRMLSAIKFRIGRPLPLHFLRRYSKAGDVDILQHTLAKYLVELSQLDYDLAHVDPSELSAAALCLSLQLLSTDECEVWSATLKFYSNYSKQDLMRTITKMAALATTASKSSLKAVFNKYCSRTKLKVALLPELKGSKIKQICRYQEDVAE